MYSNKGVTQNGNTIDKLIDHAPHQWLCTGCWYSSVGTGISGFESKLASTAASQPASHAATASISLSIVLPLQYSNELQQIVVLAHAE